MWYQLPNYDGHTVFDIAAKICKKNELLKNNVKLSLAYCRVILYGHFVWTFVWTNVIITTTYKSLVGARRSFMVLPICCAEILLVSFNPGSPQRVSGIVSTIHMLAGYTKMVNIWHLHHVMLSSHIKLTPHEMWKTVQFETSNPWIGSWNYKKNDTWWWFMLPDKTGSRGQGVKVFVSPQAW